jgi:hypothetical protein
MSRGLHTDIVTELDAAELRPALFFEVTFSGGALQFWTGQGDITVSGLSRTFIGAGNLIGFSAISESTDTIATGANFTLSGLPSSMVSHVYNEQVQGRAVSVWLGVFNSSHALIQTPALIFAGRADAIQDSDDGKTATFILSAESTLIDMKRSGGLRYTAGDQERVFAGDKGCGFVTSIQDIPIHWGRGDIDQVPPTPNSGPANRSSGL